MAVLGFARETFHGREKIIGQNGRRIYRRRFYVLTDNALDGPVVVQNAPLLPKIWEPYATTTEFDNGAVVRQVIPRQHEKNKRVWVVEVIYDSEYEKIDNPFTEPPDIRVDTEVYKQPIPGRAETSYYVEQPSPSSEDPGKAGLEPRAWGKGIVNSAGWPYDPPPEQDATRSLVIFTRNQASFSVAFKVKFENTVNKSPWSGLQARQAWLRSIKAQGHKHETNNVGDVPIYYWRVEYVFALVAETTDLQLLDYGPFYLKYPAGGGIAEKVPFMTTDRTPYMGMLDHSDPAEPGKRLDNGQEAQFNRWRAKREEDFGSLGINLNMALEDQRTRKRGAA